MDPWSKASRWEAWSECSTTCGLGQRFRTRAGNPWWDRLGRRAMVGHQKLLGEIRKSSFFKNMFNFYPCLFCCILEDCIFLHCGSINLCGQNGPFILTPSRGLGSDKIDFSSIHNAPNDQLQTNWSKPSSSAVPVTAGFSSMLKNLLQQLCWRIWRG